MAIPWPHASPLTAWAIGCQPLRSFHGPACPKQLSLTYTKPSLSAPISFSMRQLHTQVRLHCLGDYPSTITSTSNNFSNITGLSNRAHMSSFQNSNLPHTASCQNLSS